jgi:hypothetical protein
MTLRLVFISLLVTVCSYVFAQDSQVLHPPYSVYMMPTQLLNPTYSSGFTIGTEFRLCKPFSVSVEAGNFYTNGFMSKVNLKYYLRSVFGGSSEWTYYLALEYAYKSQTYIVTDKYKDPPASDIEYSVSKYVNAVHIKIGKIQNLKRRFYLDEYFGFGFRYRFVHNTLNGHEKLLYHWNEGFIDNITNSNAHRFSPGISLGVKIGFRYK